MNVMKKITLKFISLMIYLFVRLMHLTYRYRFQKESITLIHNLKKNKQNYIFSIYHQNLFPGILAQSGHPHVVIVSKSKDAEPVAFTCLRFGHVVSRGSSKRGNVDKNGSVAKEEMIEALRSGFPGAVTVDGPKGPAERVKPGIIDMAKKSGAVIIPYIVMPDQYWEFNSWDKFRLPKPFSRISISYGRPISVDANCENFEPEMMKLESEMAQEKNNLVQNRTNYALFTKHNWWNI